MAMAPEHVFFNDNFQASIRDIQHVAPMGTVLIQFEVAYEEDPALYTRGYSYIIQPEETDELEALNPAGYLQNQAGLFHTAWMALQNQILDEAWSFYNAQLEKQSELEATLTSPVSDSSSDADSGEEESNIE